MGPPEILRELEALARRLGVGLRFDPFERYAGGAGRRGGLCRLRGRTMIVVDEALPVLDKIEVVASALATFDLDRVFTPPEVRLRHERRPPNRPARPETPGGLGVSPKVPGLRKARLRPRAQG